MTNNSLTNSTDTSGLAEMVRRAMEDRNSTDGGMPPVDAWNPPFCGDLDMEIRRDGTWFYMGTPMGRKSLVRLFSSVLRKDEDGETYLVTPVEKVRIRVIDAHFLAVEMQVNENDNGQVLTFRTNVGELIEIGKDNPLRFDITGKDAELKPYFHVRGRLEALVNRATMYDLVELGEQVEMDGEAMFAVKSNGEVYPIMSMAELNAQS
ncbi:MAG: DUF1285 domain-containing protein [Lentilitoribacter sp.]